MNLVKAGWSQVQQRHLAVCFY